MEAEKVVEATAIIWVSQGGFWQAGSLLRRVLSTDTRGRRGTEVGVGREKCLRIPWGALELRQPFRVVLGGAGIDEA